MGDDSIGVRKAFAGLVDDGGISGHGGLRANPPQSAAVTAAVRRKTWILLFLLAGHVAFSLFMVVPGHLSVDEGIYHFMSRSLARSGGLAIWNGYDEFPSRELALLVGRPQDGVLMPQYPSGYTLLAAPLYWLAGFRGLFLCNALAFIGVVWLCFALAARLFQDRNPALNACLILVLASYAWEYSQAAWPHATSTLFVVAAAYLAARAIDALDARRSCAFALAGGFIAGIGTGVRLDTFFLIPALAAWFLFARPSRLRECVALFVGTLPGLVFLAILNHAKFGIFSPFTYGESGGSPTAGITAYLPLGALVLTIAVVTWAATRLPSDRLPGTPLLRLSIGLAVLGVALAFIPPVREQTVRWANGAYQLLVDLRVRDPHIIERAQMRGPGGGLVYLGSVKKALLQSCPYLVILVVPLWRLRLGGQEAMRLGFLFLVPTAFVAVFSYFAWHGGLSLNLRYFMPILPFTSILAAYAMRELPKSVGPLWRRVFSTTALVTVIVSLLSSVPGVLSVGRQEMVFLTLPLVLALLLLSLVITVLIGSASAAWARGPLNTVLTAALTWAAMTAYFYDFPRSYQARKQRAELVERISPFILPDSILFVSSGDPFYGLIDKDRVRLAMPYYDDFQDFRSLAEFHLAAGRPVYMFLDPRLNAEMERRRLLDPLTAATLFESQGGKLVQLTEADARQ